MRHVNVRTEAASVRVSRTATSAASLFETSCKALFLIWARIGLHPATAFGFLSLAFGSLVAIVLPPLRGPDEISHFLRIYSYARGELLPAAEVAGDHAAPGRAQKEIARVGATAIIELGGSVRDPEVIDAANRLGLAMVFTGVRHFRH